MTDIIRKFFAFCPEQYRRKFYAGIALGVVIALCRAMRIPAIAIILQGALSGALTTGRIAAGSLLVLLGTVCEGLLKGRATDLQTRAGYGTAADKRIEIAEHLRYMPMGYLNRKSLGEITSVTTNTMEQLQGVATRVVMLVTEGLLNTALITVAVLLFDVRIGLILAAGCAAYFLVNRKLQKQSARMTPVKTAADTRLVERVLDYLQGMQEIRAYGLSGQGRLEQAIRENTAANTEMEMALVPWMTIQGIVTKAAGAAMTLASIRFYLDGSMDLLTCMVMIIASFMVYGSLEGAGNYSGLLRIVDTCVDRAQEILSAPQMETDGAKITPGSHALTAEHLSFSYGEKEVLRDVDAVIPDGKLTAIVGPSGGGKTTFAFLLARFWDADAGRVLLGGRDVRDYGMDSLMRNYSFVFQSVYLFHDTIAANIRFGKPEAAMEEVVEAAKKACCHDFIMALPDGYETVIGEGGQTLSGGERQRISIARAIMKDSPVVVLDEATANVDPENELLLMQGIRALTGEKTVIMIAHRLKTVQRADRILVIDGGRIVQEGRHEELAGEEGVYRRFLKARAYAEGWKLQTAGTERELQEEEA